MWYAIRTETGQEEAVRERLRNCLPERDGDCRVLYCIKRKRYLGQWHDKRERFLPGYVFWVTKEAERKMYFPAIEGEALISPAPHVCLTLPGPTNEAPDMAGIKGSAENQWVTESQKEGQEILPMKKEEETLLTRLTDGKDEIGMSYGVIQDGVLKIFCGVLAGMESRVRKIDRHKRKAAIVLKINGEERTAELGLEITAKTCIPSYMKGYDLPGQRRA